MPRKSGILKSLSKYRQKVGEKLTYASFCLIFDLNWIFSIRVLARAVGFTNYKKECLFAGASEVRRYIAGFIYVYLVPLPTLSA